jgi:hypothetical protein
VYHAPATVPSNAPSIVSTSTAPTAPHLGTMGGSTTPPVLIDASAYTLLAGTPPPLTLPAGPDPGWVWGYYTLIDPSTDTPAGYHLYGSAHPFTPANGPDLTVEFVNTSLDGVATVQVGGPSGPARVPPAVSPANPNVIVWAVRLLGDANFHGRPTIPDPGIVPASSSPLEHFGIGAVRYNPSEWRYSAVRASQLTAIFFGTPLERHWLGGGVLDQLIPGLPGVPPAPWDPYRS